MHLPVAGKELVDRLLGEEVRRAVRPVKHANTPDFAVGWDQRAGERFRFTDRRRRRAGRKLWSRNWQQIGDFQRATGVATKLPQRKGRAAAKIFRHIEAITPAR